MRLDAKHEFEKVVDLFGQGKREEAATMLVALIAKNPDFYDAYESLGMIYYKMGRLDEAIEWMERLVALKDDHVMAHTNLSVFYMKKGDKEKAELEKAKAVVLNFSNPKK
jgi:tetratricopeptide (TPR) repeat protein